MRLGVEAKDVYGSIKDIADALGSTQYATKGVVENMSLFSAQLGISTKTSAQFLKTMALVGNSTMDAQKDMMYFAQHMSAAAGVPLDAVMEDVAQASQTSYQFLSRSPIELVKAAVEAKRMGTSLQSAATSSSSLLNFTESVKNEMEASVLLGKGINLQKARELAYHRDIRGLNNEILKIAQQTNFENLDPFQQDAVAKALGKSAGEVATMVQSAREHQNLMNHMTAEQRKQYKIYEDALNANDKTKLSMEDQAKAQIQQISNQAALKSITLAWSSIFARLGQSILPTIAEVLTGIAKILGGVADSIGWVEDKVSSISGWMGGLLKILLAASAAAVLLVGARGLGKLVSWATGGIGKGIGKMFTGVANGVGKFGTGNVLKGALGIAALGVALFVFAKSLLAFATVKWSSVWIGLGALVAFGTISGIMGALSEDIIPGAIAIGLLGLALIPFAKALSAFAAVKWSSVWIGLGALVAFGVVAGIMGALSELIIPGAIAIGLLGLALIPFAAAAWIASKALKNLSDVPLLKIAGGLLALGFAAPAIVAGGVALGLASPGLIAFSVALRFIAGPAERVGKAMAELGSGMKMTVDALAELKTLGFIDTILQLKNLSSTIKELSKSINDMPKIKVEKLKSFALPLSGGTVDKGTEKKGESTNDILSVIKDGIEGIRNDFKNGTITANVYLDSQKLDAAIGRRLKYTGTLT